MSGHLRRPGRDACPSRAAGEADQFGRVPVASGEAHREHRPQQGESRDVPGSTRARTRLTPMSVGALGERGEQQAADATAVPGVDHLERDLGLVRAQAVADEPGDPDGLAPRRRDQGHVVPPVDGEQGAADRCGQRGIGEWKRRWRLCGESPANTVSSSSASSRRSGRTWTSRHSSREWMSMTPPCAAGVQADLQPVDRPDFSGPRPCSDPGASRPRAAARTSPTALSSVSTSSRSPDATTRPSRSSSPWV